MDKEFIDIWTDGACKGNPGIGGWGALLKHGGHSKEMYGGELNTTNNRMEMTAVIQALQQLKRKSKVRLYIDSQYVKKGLNEWMPSWVARGWKTANKQPVKNKDLWLILNELTSLHDITWVWVKGHAGNKGNERADALANLGVEQVQAS